MIKGTIKAISTKNNSILLAIGTDEEWKRVDPVAIGYAKRGEAEIEYEEDGQTVKLVKMVSIYPPKQTPSRFSFNGTGGSPQFSPSNQDREKKIIRQSCLKAAVDFVNGIPYEKRTQATITEYAEVFEKWVNRDEAKS